MTTARPTVSLIAHVDPRLKEWIKVEAQARGTSQQKLVEEILSGYMSVTEEIRRHPEESVNFTALRTANDLEAAVWAWEEGDHSDDPAYLVEKIQELIRSLRGDD